MGLALAWVALAIILAGLSLLILFKGNVERTMRDDLSSGLMRLVAVIQPEIDEPTISEPLPDPRYSTPLSGSYWQIEALESGLTARSRSLWDFVLDVPRPPSSGQELFTTLPGPEGQQLAVLSRQIKFDTANGSRSYQVSLAEDRAVLDQSIAQFRVDASTALLLLGLFLMIAAWAQVKIGLSPIHTLREAIEAIRRGQKDRLEGPYPSELTPLVNEVNELLSGREKSMEYARSRAADLAHGLKTPLSVLRSTADRLEEKGDAESAALMMDLATEMSERIDYQLRLASLRIRAGAYLANASLNAALIRTIGVLKKTHRGENLGWFIELGADVVVDMERQDLLELMGVVLENATKWADSRITITTRQVDGMAEVEIGDDGPGLTAAQIEQIGVRGRRIDESRGGSGFGLAIALEIVRLNEGQASFGRSSLGGLNVTLKLPLNQIDRSS